MLERMCPKRPLPFLVPLLLTATASAQWSSNPALNLAIADGTGDQAVPKIAASGDGSTWIGWFDGSTGAYQVRVQRLDPQGVETFAHNGLVVSAHPQNTSLVDWHMVADCTGGVVLAFTDIRAGGDLDAYAYRIDASGAFVWGANGVTLSTDAEFEANPRLTVSEDCSAVVVVWARATSPGPGSLRVQRLDMAGNQIYAQDGLAITGTGTEKPSFSDVVASDNGSYVVSWVRDISTFQSPRHLRSQKYDAAGNPLWGAAPVNVYDAASVPIAYRPQMLSDGAGGAIYGWYSAIGNTFDCWLQRVDSTGAETYAHNGLQVSTQASTGKFSPSIARCAGSGDVLVAFDNRNSGQSLRGLAAQRISPAGTRLWGADGIQLYPIDATVEDFARVVAFDEDAVVACFQGLSPTASAVRAFRLDSSGAAVWSPSPVDLSTVVSGKDDLEACVDGSGVVRYAWDDERTSGGDIYAQNVDCDGSLGNTSPAGWTNYCVGAPNTVGPGAVMSASGSASLALDNFVLGCSGLPPSTNGIFFFGAMQIQVPFGNGFRCVGGTIVRFGVQTTTPAGTVQRAIQQMQLPGGPIPAGATRDFQFWYRNPLAGGAGFNLSDGLTATFCP